MRAVLRGWSGVTGKRDLNEASALTLSASLPFSAWDRFASDYTDRGIVPWEEVGQRNHRRSRAGARQMAVGNRSPVTDRRPRMAAPHDRMDGTDQGSSASCPRPPTEQLQRDVVETRVLQQNTGWWILGEGPSPPGENASDDVARLRDGEAGTGVGEGCGPKPGSRCLGSPSNRLRWKNRISGGGPAAQARRSRSRRVGDAQGDQG